MCQYSADVIGDQVGVPNEWHRTHLVSRAIGGTGLILTEATAVNPEGRISAADLGIWNDTQAQAFAEINAQLAYFGAVPRNSAGPRRTQSVDAGSVARRQESARRRPTLVADGCPRARFRSVTLPIRSSSPRRASRRVVADFAAAATRALKAEFKVVEIHAAPRIPDPSVPLPREQQANGPLRRQLREPHPIAPRNPGAQSARCGRPSYRSSSGSRRPIG